MDQGLVEKFIDRAMRNEFIWGKDDCCLWVCDLILEASGVDLAEPLRGYSTERGAMRKLKRYAGGGLCEAAVKLAQRARLKHAAIPYTGNLVGIVADQAGPALALFYNERWLGRTQRGFTALPYHFATVAWEVPKCHPH